MKPLTRRHFLEKSSAALAATMLGTGKSSADESPAPGKILPFGLVTYLWGEDWDLPTLLRNCETSGLLAIELRTTHAHGVEPALTRAERMDVRKRFADSPVTLLGPGSNENFDSPDPDVLAASIRRVKDFLRLSHDLGGTGVKVKPNDFHAEVLREKTLEQIGRSLREVAEFGEQIGQEVRMEVHGSCAHLPDMKTIAEIADHPRARLCWNSNPQDLEGDGLEATFKLARPYFGQTLHVHELDDPKYPYEKLARLLAASKYPGWVLLEASGTPGDRVAAMAEQRRHWEKAVAKALEGGA